AVTFNTGEISVAATGTELSGANTIRVADGVEAATISLQLRDVNGNAIEQADVEVTFSTDLGLLDNGNDDPALTATAVTNASGIASVTLTSTTAGSASVTATINHDDDDGTTPEVAVVNGRDRKSVVQGRSINLSGMWIYITRSNTT